MTAFKGSSGGGGGSGESAGGTYHNIKTEFGATGLVSGDDTDAFNAAIAAVTDGDWIYVPAGIYMVHELNMHSTTRIIGDARFNTKLCYNGAGGAGSTVLIQDTARTHGDLGGNEIVNLGIEGYGRSSATPVAESCLRWSATASPDFGWTLRNSSLQYCYGDAFYLDTGFINLFMRDVRMDVVGGYALNISSPSGMERRVFHIQDFTYGNELSTSNFKTALTNQGLWDVANDRFGRGFLLAEDCIDTTFHLQDGRIEQAHKQVIVDDRVSSIRSVMNVAGFQTIILENVKGYFNSASEGGIMVYAPLGKTLLSADGYTSMTDQAKLFETATIANDIASGGPFFSTSMKGLSTAARGYTIDTQAFEFRTAVPSGNNVYHYGDIIMHSDAALGENVGWMVTAPATGFGRADNPTHETAGVTTAASATVTVTASNMRKFGTGTALTITGAGAAGVDLDCIITDVDIQAHTITISPAASTSVSPATIKQRVPTFTTFGYVGEKRGATSVADGGTITHGVGATPTNVQLTATVASEIVSVTTIGSTTFTVAIKKDDGTAGTTQTVHWRAIP